MTTETAIFLAAGALWLLTVCQGAWALWGGVLFYRTVSRMVEQAPRLMTDAGRFKYQPAAVVILPCRGIDQKLEQTVQALARQNYADYQVIFTFESQDDPAYAAIGKWTRDWTTPQCWRVAAGLADQRSQKIHNLLAALEHVPDDREVLVFLDSDAVPHPGWLGHLVAPLGDETVGAATGYRWYSATGGLAAGMRCAWNAATVTLLDDEKLNFCWGGATAIRRETFDRTRVAEHWDRALSDDYHVTRAVRGAGLRIRFVPQALIPSTDRTTMRDFWTFARRQVVITRVCGPRIWRAGLVLCCNFVLGGSSAAALFFAAALDWFGDRRLMVTALCAWLIIVTLAAGKAVLRQLAVRKVLRPPIITWRDFGWDVGGVGFTGLLHLALMLASLSSRRITWRDTVYEMVSPDETRIVGRAGSVQDPFAQDKTQAMRSEPRP